MADMMSTLKTLLGDNADEKIKNAMSMLQNSGLIQNNRNTQASDMPVSTQNAVSNNESVQAKPDTPTVNSSQPNAQATQGQQPVLTPEGIQFIGQIRNMVDQITNTNDSRSELLRSLRPFMRSDRQRSIDRAIRIMNIGRFSGLFGR